MKKLSLRLFSVFLSLVLLLMSAPVGSAAHLSSLLPSIFADKAAALFSSFDLFSDDDAEAEDTDEDTDDALPPLSVQVNGEDLTFAYGKPELFPPSGRTMVPFRAVAEALGGVVDYDAENRTVSTVVDGISLSFTIGNSRLTRTQNGKAEQLQMDIAPYETAGTTYVPVRFFADALSLSVLWDADARTAVIFDRAGLMDAIDSHFTIYNKWAGSFPALEEGKLGAVSAPFSLSLSQKNEAGKEFTFSLEGTMEASYKEGQYRYDITMNAWPMVSALVEMLSADGSLPAEAAAMLALYKTDLEKLTLSMLIDREKGMVYFQCPLLTKVMQYVEPTLFAVGDVWYSVALPAEMLSSLKATSPSAQPTVSEIILLLAEAEDDPTSLYSRASELCAALETFFGDSALTGKDGVYTVDLAAAMTAAGMAPVFEDGESVASTLTLDANTPAADFYWNSVQNEGSLLCNVHAAETTSDIEMTFTSPTASFTFKMNCTRKTTEGEVRLLPAGAVIFPLDA